MNNNNGIISLQQGALGEAAVIKELIRQGYSIFTQFSGHSPFDMVAYKDNKLFRVSVKSTIYTHNKSSWRVSISQGSKSRSNYKKFDNTSCDILAVYIVLEDRVILYDSSVVTNGYNLCIPKI